MMNNKKAKILMKWVQELGYNVYKEKSCMLITKDKIKLKLYTDMHEFTIIAAKNYLGCVASCRKMRAGEDWTRGNDLPDGSFCEKTWIKIIKAIVGYSLVKIERPINNS